MVELGQELVKPSDAKSQELSALLRASLNIDLETLKRELRRLRRERRHLARAYIVLAELSARLEAFGTDEQRELVNKLAEELRPVLRKQNELERVAQSARQPVKRLFMEVEYASDEMQPTRAAMDRLRDLVDSAVCHRDPRWLAFFIECGIDRTSPIHVLDAEKLLARCRGRLEAYDDGFSRAERIDRFMLQVGSGPVKKWWSRSRAELLAKVMPGFRSWVQSNEPFVREFRAELVKRSNGFRQLPEEVVKQLGVERIADILKRAWKELSEEEQRNIEKAVWQPVWDKEERKLRDKLRFLTQSVRLRETLQMLKANVSSADSETYYLETRSHLLPFLAELQVAQVEDVVLYGGRLVHRALVGAESGAEIAAITTKAATSACWQIVSGILAQTEVDDLELKTRKRLDELLAAMTQKRFEFETGRAETAEVVSMFKEHGWKFPEATQLAVRRLSELEMVDDALRVAQRSRRRENVEWLFEFASGPARTKLEEAVMSSLQRPSKSLISELTVTSSSAWSPTKRRAKTCFTYDQARKLCIQKLGTSYFEENPEQLKKLKKRPWLRQAVPGLEELYLSSLNDNGLKSYMVSVIRDDDIRKLRLIENSSRESVLEDRDYYLLRQAVARNATQIVDYALEKLELSPEVIDAVGCYALRASEEMIEKIHEYNGHCVSGLAIGAGMRFSAPNVSTTRLKHLLRHEWIGKRVRALIGNDVHGEVEELSRLQEWLAEAATNWTPDELRRAADSKAVRSASKLGLPMTKSQIIAMTRCKDPSIGTVL